VIAETVFAWAGAAETSALAAAVRMQPWIYPAANLVHVLGVSLLVGAIMALDLRLLGAFRRSLPAAGAVDLLVPVAVVGAILAVPSGILLYLPDAVPLTGHLLMQVKAGLLVLGLANAVAFHLLWHRRLARWDAGAPPVARAQSVFSIAIWLGVLSCGRLIAYV
jgi:hypothetical protein